MPLPVPNLDDRSFGQLVAEGRSLIPRYSRVWTDHNPSDPGITLLELFAWVTEAELYGTDQVPEETVERFLALLGSPREGSEGIDAAVVRAVRSLSPAERAITAAEFEAHAREVGGDAVARAEYVVVEEPVLRHVAHRPGRRVSWTRATDDGERIAVLGGIDERGLPWRATEQAVLADVDAGRPYYVEEPLDHLVPLVAARRGATRYVKTVADADTADNLLSLPQTPPPPGRTRDTAGVPAERLLPGHDDPLHPGEPAPVGMLLVVATDPDLRERPAAQYPLLDAIFRELQRRRLLTSRFHVAPPDYVRVTVDVRVARLPGSGLSAETVQERIQRFLDPVSGGEGGGGWPFGRSVYRSELFQQLEQMSEVDHVTELELRAPDAETRVQSGNVLLRPTELVHAGAADVAVEVGEA